MAWAPWSKDDQRLLERLRKSGHTVREIHEQHFPHVPLSSIYRYAQRRPARFTNRPPTPGVRHGNTRATTPALDEVIAYLYTRGMNGPALARVFDLTPRITQHRISADNLLAYRHEYQRKALERCADDLRASGLDPDAALARLDAEHEAEVNGRFKEDE